MTLYRSRTPGQPTQDRIARLASRLRHHGINFVEAELVTRATVDPPVYRETVAHFRWLEQARRQEAWEAAGRTGHWTDAEFDEGFSLEDGAL